MSPRKTSVLMLLSLSGLFGCGPERTFPPPAPAPDRDWAMRLIQTGGLAGVHLLREYLEFAIQTAHEAGRLTLGYFQTGLKPDMKPDDTPVTAADRKAEELIRARIESRYPGHRIVGEEFGAQGADTSAPCWWIDPIDGTKAFVRGVPLYAVLLGLEIDGKIAVGTAYFPALDEMLYAADGLGCHLNGRPCRVSATQTLTRGIVSFTNPASFKAAQREAAWQRILAAAYHSVGWSDLRRSSGCSRGSRDRVAPPRCWGSTRARYAAACRSTGSGDRARGRGRRRRSKTLRSSVPRASGIGTRYTCGLGAKTAGS